MSSLRFDLRHVPFSRFGSYLTFSHLERADPPGLYLRTVHGDAEAPELFQISLHHGGIPVAFEEIASPTRLRLQAEEGFVEFCIAEANLIRMRGEGISLRLTLAMQGGYDTRGERWDHAISPDGTRWDVISFSRRLKVKLVPLIGSLSVDAPWTIDMRCPHVVADFVPDEITHQMEGAVETFQSGWVARTYSESFDSYLRQIEADFDTWRETLPDLPDELADAGDLAAYVNWSAVVEPLGFLTRPTMLMSKNWMIRVWGWDHCLNAIALAEKDPRLAWDQVMLFFDNQHPDGALPDAISDTGHVWTFCKPPVQGWTIGMIMRQTGAITRDDLQMIYDPLCRWTNWWFNYRDDDHDGIPQYNHGNESGWDNATVFDQGMPVESPDLATYLVLQLEALGEIALRLGRWAEAGQWRYRADQLLQRFIAHSWNGEQFVAPHSGDHRVVGLESLMSYMPLLLGKRLPAAILEKLVTGVKPFLAEYGLATELPSSPLYNADGYWRGPIWAPPTLFIVSGLYEIGECELARAISRRYCHMVARAGMAENFDALTGIGYRDRAYTWTSSVFITLAHALINEKAFTDFIK